VNETVERYRKAIAILERVPPLPPFDEHRLATIHARLAVLATRPGSGVLASDGQFHSDRAMSSLRKARDGGYKPPVLYGEREFESLHARPDFQRLIMDPAMPQNPFAPLP
jgi:hypothetical protein